MYTIITKKNFLWYSGFNLSGFYNSGLMTHFLDFLESIDLEIQFGLEPDTQSWVNLYHLFFSVSQEFK